MRKIYLIILAMACMLHLGCTKYDMNSSTGKGGSTARFTIYGDYLYAVNNSKLSIISISEPAHARVVAVTPIGENIETIYPYQGKLFIGSANAMYIYSLDDPERPMLEGMASHVRACDPVVAYGNFAFVTVRGGDNQSPCGGNTNALFVYNILNLKSPSLLHTYNMKNPHGLGVVEDYLYVCDASAGLYVFDIKNPARPNVRKVLSGYVYEDVIPYDDLLICKVLGGMVIYDISNPGEPIFVAKTF